MHHILPIPLIHIPPECNLLLKIESQNQVTAGTTVNSDNPCNVMGNRWRLPNISELAIMRSLGIASGGPYASCTMAPFNNAGTKVEPDQLTSTTHYFLFGLSSTITQAFSSPSLFYCVRDRLTP